jgi:hypothetical protein
MKKLIVSCYFLLFIFCPSLSFSGSLNGNIFINGNTGKFEYDCKNSNKKISIYYYAPEKLNKNSQIVFIMHGDSRNGAMYRDEWQRHAKKYNFLILCPELSKKDFSFWDYNCGNIYDYEKKQFNPKEKWNFNLIEQLFDLAKKECQLTADSYAVFGHSSGAQFVQKMVLFMPEARFSTAIANGAGWYTLPDFDRKFYGGLKGTPIVKDDLKRSFEKELVILMGSKDFFNKQRPESYDKTTHKWDRLWRAKFFYKSATDISKELETELNWVFRIVPNADHNNPNHAIRAAQHIAMSQRKNAKREKTNPSSK